MDYEECIKTKGHAIMVSNISDWENNSLTAAKYNSLLYCIKGSANIEVNLKEFMLVSDSYVVIPGDSLVKCISKTEDFEAIKLLNTTEVMMSVSIGMNMDTMQNIFVNPYNRVLYEREAKIMKNLFTALELYAEMPNFAHHADFAFGLIRNLFIMIADIGMSAKKDNMQSVVFTTADSYFINFIKLLHKHCCQQHDVAFYADKLSITPKYLNEIARKTANYTAKDIISKFLVARIKRELIISGNSVQRIAYDFNFCDQSSLGKFFKKATGMSPVAFRRSRQ